MTPTVLSITTGITPALHAGKYILGITAPTGTGVQALPPGNRSQGLSSPSRANALERGKPFNAPGTKMSAKSQRDVPNQTI
jgi:hypothetical protein